VGVAADEYGRFAIVVHDDASATAVSLIDGSVLERRKLVDKGEPTAVSFDARRNALAVGFADGAVQLGTVKMSARRLEAADVPEEARRASTGLRVGDAWFERLPDGGFRRQALVVDLQSVVAGERDSAVVLIATGASAGRSTLALWRRDGSAAVSEVRTRENMATGEITLKLETAELAAVPAARKDPPTRLFVSDLGDTAMAVWADGYTVRHDTRDLSQPRIAEVFDLAPPVDRSISSAVWMIGTSTLVVGASSGEVDGWFRTKPDVANTTDGGVMTKAHTLEKVPRRPPRSACRVATASSRRDTPTAPFGIHNMTAGATVGTLRPFEDPVLAVDMFPRNDGVVAFSKSGIAVLSLHADYAEVTVSSILRPVWYEGYGKPEHVWQSSSGSDDFEAKFGLFPLVFGT
jgi:phosphate transport system permease protein